MAAGEASATKPRQEKQYDYLLKFLLVGDSDVGKQEIDRQENLCSPEAV